MFMLLCMETEGKQFLKIRIIKNVTKYVEGNTEKLGNKS